MAGLIYFVERRQAMKSEALEGVGLGHLSGASLSYVPGAKGPEGRHGVAFCVAAPGRSAGNPQRCTAVRDWTPVGQAWVGVDPDQRPAPLDLQRPLVIPGRAVQLADGMHWLVPVARLLKGGTGLPQALTYVDGEWSEGPVESAYQRLWEAACETWDALNSGDGSLSVTVHDGAETASMALGTNYYLGPAEIGALRLLNTRLVTEVLKALVDWQTLEAILNDPKALSRVLDGLSSGPGAED